jgi:hypothetical protein
MTLAEVKPQTGYELTIHLNPDGSFTGQVTKDGTHCSGSTKIGTRDEVIAAAKAYAEWHSAYGETADEVIPL